MALSPYIPTYYNTAVTPSGLGTFHINWVEAGSRDHPTILLLHGFPASSNQYRDFIPLLSNDYHVLAPDLPGFGLTKSPADLEYTFDNLTAAISAWLIALNITSFVSYMFDYGAPVAQRLALANPDHVKAIVTPLWKEEVQQQLQAQINQIDQQLQQIDMEGQRAISAVQKQSLQPPGPQTLQQIENIQGQVNQKKSELLEQKNQSLQNLQQVQFLELDQEVNQFQMESFFHVEPGDNLINKLNVEVVLRDGVVEEIRGDI